MKTFFLVFYYNEINTLPQLLKYIDLKGNVVTGDVIYCQKDITKQIVEAQADYVLALKGNHPTLFEDVKLFMKTEYDKNRLNIHEIIEKDHGRIEIRKYVLSTDLDWLEQRTEWTALKAMVMVESTRIIGDNESTERRYDLSSLTDVEEVAGYIRSHWAIENSQHWGLDVSFREDDAVKCNRNAKANRVLLSRTALNLIRANGDDKISMKRNKTRTSQNLKFHKQLLLGKSDL